MCAQEPKPADTQPCEHVAICRGKNQPKKELVAGDVVDPSVVELDIEDELPDEIDDDDSEDSEENQV